ncbi:MAG: maleylpyruvate isomerase family mycothiol-dependent enzyme [Candidatus Dormiibacterota bacterium]
MRADGDRIALVADGRLDAAVPPCPGWTVRDVVTHLAEVYEHKMACTLLGRMPDPWPPLWPPERDPVAWLVDAQRRLLTLFRERGPEAPSATWWPPDQTVGFWDRRMAHETVIHRVDVEISLERLTAVDPDLAIDGVDEVLTIFLAGDWSEDPDDRCLGQRIVVNTGDRSWEVELLPEAVIVSPSRGGADAVVSGEPEEVLLWLWGRGSDTGLAHLGDPAVPVLLRDRLKLATQ